MKLFANNGLEWAKDFIEANNKDSANSTFANKVADRTNGFLATLQSAYGRIANNPNISGNLPAELEKELSKSEFNFGMTPEQLHQAVADQLISSFIEPGVLQVSQALREAASNWHPFKGTIGDVVFNTAAILTSWIATVGIYPIEWIIRKLFLNLFVSRYVVNGTLVKSLVSSSVGSIQQNGYTHALNCVLYDQLKYVYVTLQRHYNGGTKDEEEESVDLNKFSIVDRGKLTTLVQELFSVLEKHQCNSPEELRRFINDNSTLKKLKGDFEDQFVYSKIVKSLEEVIGAALHTFLTKDQLEKQFYQLLTTVNSIFKKGETIPLSEYQQKEDDINRVIDSLLLLVIDNSLNELADFDREHEQLGVDAQVEELANLAKSLYKGLRVSYRKLGRTVEDVEYGVPHTAKNEDLLHDMTTKSSHFLSKVIEWRTRVQSPENGLSKEAKEALLELEANLRDQIESMVISLNAIYGPRAKLSLGEKIAEVLEKFKSLLESIVHYITGYEDGPVSRKLEALKEQFQKLQKEPALHTQASIIREKIEELEKLVEEKKKMKPLQNVLDEDLNPENLNSALKVWLKTKQENDFAKVKQALERISKSTAEHKTLTKLISQMKKDSSALKEYKDEWKAIRKELNERQEKLSEAAEKLEERCNKVVDKCSFSDEESFDETWMLVDLGMKQLKDWIDSPSSVKLAKDNSFLRPLKEKAIQLGKNYVTDRVRNKSTGVLSLIRDKIIWHHGLYNHNILFPFVGKN